MRVAVPKLRRAAVRRTKDLSMLSFRTHGEGEALSTLMRGGSCEQFTARAGRRYGGDQVVYRMGDAAPTIYFLRSGLVKLTALSPDGREIILDIQKPGGIFGLVCLCGAPRGEMAVAMVGSEIVEIPLAELVGRLQQSPEALASFLATVCQQLAKAYDTIQELSFESLPVRLAKTLLRLAQEMGHETEQGVELEHYLTQEELAQLLSARREVVSTVLGRMREQGLVAYSRRGKLTINRPALVAFVEG
jgi:CRP/FNR family cyclic AMP-dependent transcriptional regulator